MKNKTVMAIILIAFMLYTGMLSVVMHDRGYKKGREKGIDLASDYCREEYKKEFRAARVESRRRVDSILKANRKFYDWYYNHKQNEAKKKIHSIHQKG